MIASATTAVLNFINSASFSSAYISSTGGKAGGILPMLKVYNYTAKYINQSGRRPGSFAMSLEPWHSDIFQFLDAKKNHYKMGLIDAEQVWDSIKPWDDPEDPSTKQEVIEYLKT